MAQTQNYIKSNDVIVWAELPAMPTADNTPNSTPVIEVIAVHIYQMVKDFIFFLQPNDLPYGKCVY